MFKDKIILTNNRNLLSVLLTFIIFISIILVIVSNVLFMFDKRIQDLYYKLNDVPINKDIVVVEIDEDTLAGRKDSVGNISIEGLGRFPIDRKYYATVIDNLKNAGASVIALDIIFGEKSENETSDDIFAESIKNAGNVILGVWTNSVGIVQFPYSKFNNNIYYYGYNAPDINTITDNVYSFTPYWLFRGSDQVFNYFSVSILKSFYSKIYNEPNIINEKPLVYADKILFGDRIKLQNSVKLSNEELELSKKIVNGEISIYNNKDYQKTNYNEEEFNNVVNKIRMKQNFLINYSTRNFQHLSFLDVYNNQFDKNKLKDKIVLIGVTAKAIKDDFKTPLGKMYGVYVHANALNTILTKNYLVYINVYVELILIFLLILVSVYFNLSKSSYILIFSNISLVSIFILLVIYFIGYTNLLLNYPIELGLAFLISFAISNIVKYYIENKHKTKLNKALSEYVSEDVANEILSGAGLVNLNGERKEIAIFFSDIQGFTSISEKLSPEELVSFLREYLGDMSNIIMSDKGYIDKYEGDAIMALWGVFGLDELSTFRICNSALLQQKKLIELNNLWKDRGYGEIKARIGMHYGSAVVGDIGSEGGKKNFTALGDNVNLASRLEGVNKFYGTFICASETIYDLQKDNFEFRYLDKIRVKGKAIPIKIYELLGIKGEVPEEIINIKQEFEEATTLYLNRDFSKAKEIFQNLLDNGDNAPRLYLDMCEIYLKTPPPDDWDGVSEMLSK